MWCGFDENLGNKARVVQGSLLLTTFARVCGKFCSETFHIAAAHTVRTCIFKLTVPEHQVDSEHTQSIFKTHILEEKRALFRRGYSIVSYYLYSTKEIKAPEPNPYQAVQAMPQTHQPTAAPRW
jgi:hypothetical protein